MPDHVGSSSEDCLLVVTIQNQPLEDAIFFIRISEPLHFRSPFVSPSSCYKQIFQSTVKFFIKCICKVDNFCLWYIFRCCFMEGIATCTFNETVVYQCTLNIIYIDVPREKSEHTAIKRFVVTDRVNSQRFNTRIMLCNLAF